MGVCKEDGEGTVESGNDMGGHVVLWVCLVEDGEGTVESGNDMGGHVVLWVCLVEDGWVAMWCCGCV